MKWEAEQMELLGMVRNPDHETSIEAAKELVPKLGQIHQKVLDAFLEHGEMTDGELENLPQFSSYGPSTIRKRRSELYQSGRLVDTGRTRENERGKSMVIWRLP